jgi:hypothetical protein
MYSMKTLLRGLASNLFFTPEKLALRNLGLRSEHRCAVFTDMNCQAAQFSGRT